MLLHVGNMRACQMERCALTVHTHTHTHLSLKSNKQTNVHKPCTNFVWWWLYFSNCFFFVFCKFFSVNLRMIYWVASCYICWYVFFPLVCVQMHKEWERTHISYSNNVTKNESSKKYIPNYHRGRAVHSMSMDFCWLNCMLKTLCQRLFVSVFPNSSEFSYWTIAHEHNTKWKVDDDD